ncbi:MAG: 3'-5' exonuclease [Flaviflexus sp.]|nr:3'-5' exonuclease [Flaviflexus sp.]
MYAVVDVETTGLDPVSDRIIDIGVIIADNNAQPVEHYTTRINPLRPVDATFIHGLTDADLADSPTFEDIVQELADLLNGNILVAHNASFDAKFLRAAFERAGYTAIIDSHTSVCTMDQSRIYLPEGSHKLLACVERAGVPSRPAHRGLADTQCALELFQHYRNAEHLGQRHTQSALNRHEETVLPAAWTRAKPMRITTNYELRQNQHRASQP